jgi:hypothetical protein
MKRVFSAAVLATIAFTVPALAADPILSRLAGSWTGRGSYRESASAVQERVFCKITNTLVQGGNALQQSGRCSISSGSSPIDGIIKAQGGGRYSGSLSSLASEGPAGFSGSGSGGRLTLNMSFIDPHTHEKARSVSTMTLTGNGYRLTSTRKDGGAAWTSNDVSFTK